MKGAAHSGTDLLKVTAINRRDVARSTLWICKLVHIRLYRVPSGTRELALHAPSCEIFESQHAPEADLIALLRDRREATSLKKAAKSHGERLLDLEQSVGL